MIVEQIDLDGNMSGQEFKITNIERGKNGQARMTVSNGNGQQETVFASGSDRFRVIDRQNDTQFSRSPVLSFSIKEIIS